MKLDDSYLETLLTRLNTAVAVQNASEPKLGPEEQAVAAEIVEPAIRPASAEQRIDLPIDEVRPSVRQAIVERRFTVNGAQAADWQDIAPERVPGEFWPLAPADCA